MQRSNIEVETDYIRETWYPIYRKHFLKLALNRAYDGRKAYYLYSQQGAECDVSTIFFYKNYLYFNFVTIFITD